MPIKEPKIKERPDTDPERRPHTGPQGPVKEPEKKKAPVREPEKNKPNRQ